MPYITPNARKVLDNGKACPIDAGELNYVITKALLEETCPIKLGERIEDILEKYLQVNGTRYQRLNDILGVLFLAPYEYRRRKGVNHPAMFVTRELAARFLVETYNPYEDAKIKENGDINGYAQNQEPIVGRESDSENSVPCGDDCEGTPDIHTV